MLSLRRKLQVVEAQPSGHPLTELEGDRSQRAQLELRIRLLEPTQRKPNGLEHRLRIVDDTRGRNSSYVELPSTRERYGREIADPQRGVLARAVGQANPEVLRACRVDAHVLSHPERQHVGLLPGDVGKRSRVPGRGAVPLD